MPKVDYEVSSPGWLQFLVTVLKTSGPVAVIAFVLVYFLVHSVTNSIEGLGNEIKTNHNEIISAKVEMHAFATTHSQIEYERARQYNMMLQVLRQMCVNTADSPAARAGCYVEK